MGDYLFLAAVIALFWIAYSVSKVAQALRAFHADFRQVNGIKPGTDAEVQV